MTKPVALPRQQIQVFSGCRNPEERRLDGFSDGALTKYVFIIKIVSNRRFYCLSAQL